MPGGPRCREGLVAGRPSLPGLFLAFFWPLLGLFRPLPGLFRPQAPVSLTQGPKPCLKEVALILSKVWGFSF